MEGSRNHSGNVGRPLSAVVDSLSWQLVQNEVESMNLIDGTRFEAISGGQAYTGSDVANHSPNTLSMQRKYAAIERQG